MKPGLAVLEAAIGADDPLGDSLHPRSPWIIPESTITVSGQHVDDVVDDGCALAGAWSTIAGIPLVGGGSKRKTDVGRAHDGRAEEATRSPGSSGR